MAAGDVYLYTVPPDGVADVRLSDPSTVRAGGGFLIGPGARNYAALVLRMYGALMARVYP